MTRQNLILTLNPLHFRINPEVAEHMGQQIHHVTKCNIDTLLDSRAIQCAMKSGHWWDIRRNGVTQRWKRDTSRIRIPYKFGLYGYGAITEADFVLCPEHISRLVADIKCQACSWMGMFPGQWQAEWSNGRKGQ